MTAFVTSFTPGTLRNDFSGCVGYSFTVGGAGLTVNFLGRWKVAGNSQTHTVRIMSAINTTIASASVDMSTGSAGTFVYTAITPLSLSASTKYWIFSSETDTLDQWYDKDNTNVVVDGMASLVNAEYALVCGVDIVPNGTTAYGVPNFSTDAAGGTRPVKMADYWGGFAGESGGFAG